MCVCVCVCVYVCEQDLALINPQNFIWHKTQSNQFITNGKFVILTHKLSHLKFTKIIVFDSIYTALFY